MNYETRPRELLRLVKPQQVRSYALAKGWQRVPGVNGEIALFDLPNSQWRQLVVPMDETFDDYDKRVFDVVQTLSEIESRPGAEILNDLLMPDSDVLRFGVASTSTARGLVPLTDGIALVEGAKKSLLAAACSVVNPVRHHPRMTRTEATQLIAACQLGQTERGSFTLALSCPVHAIEADQALLWGEKPFARSATLLLMRSIQRVVRAIEADRETDVLEPSATEPVVSANLCDAILQMQPSGEQAALNISISWATTLPPHDPIPQTVRIKAEYFPIIEEIFRKLLPARAPASSLFFGRVVTLNGQPGDDGRMQGEITLALLHDEEILRARADLSPDDYQKAVDAHREAEPVKFLGILHLGRRIHRVTGITAFSTLKQ